MLGDRGDEESSSKADEDACHFLPAWGVVALAGDVDAEADAVMIAVMSFEVADLLEVVIDEIPLPAAVPGKILSCRGGV